MVSKKFALVVGVAVFVVALLVMAGVASAYTPGLRSNIVGSDHDLTSELNVCESCHVPHYAKSTQFLWATEPNDTGGGQTGGLLPGDDYTSDIKPLCYSCHDGTSTSRGSNTVFDVTKYNHPTRSLTVRGSAGRDCDLCHDPHENNHVRDNFIRYDRINSSSFITILGPNMCASCHTGAVDGGMSGHVPPGTTFPTHNHPININDVVVTLGTTDPALLGGPMTQYNPNTDVWGVRWFDPISPNRPLPSLADDATLNCESCHAPHGGFNITINTQETEDGGLCTNCHA